MDGEAAALAANRAAFAEPVEYRKDEASPAITELPVIWSDSAGEAFQGPGNTTRTITAEIEQGTVPARPTKATRIKRSGRNWKVIEVNDRDDVGAWVVTLELL